MNAVEQTPEVSQAIAVLLTERAKLSDTMARVDTETDEEQDRFDALLSERHRIDREIWAIPAANAADVFVKLSISTMDDPNASCFSAADEHIFDDLRRLGGFENKVTPAFCAADWLAVWVRHGGGYVIREDGAVLCAILSSERLADLREQLRFCRGETAVQALILAEDAAKLGEAA